MNIHDYIIVGAGPGGLQLGYYLAKCHRNFVILERGTGVATFFRKFPRHRKLLSINKVHTGFDDAQINLRWDWNSLLTDDNFKFTDFSHAYFPSADDLVRYLEEFARRYALPIQFDTEITNIRRDGDTFVIETNCGEMIARRLIMATGRTTPNIPDVEGIEHAEDYSTVSVEPEDFTDQRVLIVGKGNSGFEMADSIMQTAAAIHLLSPSPVRLAWKSHYVGDVRATNNNVLDTYQLKSQNTILDGHLIYLARRADDRLDVRFGYSHAAGQTWDLVVDRVITCCGFHFNNSIFDARTCPIEVTADGRFPRMAHGWESISVPNLFFAGCLMHERDYRISFSGFIHGFRYSVECLARLLDERYEGGAAEEVRLARNSQCWQEYILDRIHHCSSLFQQPAYLCDAIILYEHESIVRRDLPVEYIENEFTDQETLQLTFEYGKLAAHDDPFNVNRFPQDGSTSKFIHPVLRHKRGTVLLAEHHVPEDLENEWRKPVYVEPLTDFLQKIHYAKRGVGRV